MKLLSFIRSLTSGRLGHEARILVLGLDNAGKSTILARLSEEEIATIRPTQGFVVKSLKHDNIRLNVWDVGGQKSIRPYWRNYFADTDALVRFRMTFAYSFALLWPNDVSSLRSM